MKRSRGTQSKHGRRMRGRDLVSVAKQLVSFAVGERVRIRISPRFAGKPPLKFNNRAAVVLGKQGSSFSIQFNDGGKSKNLVVRGIHLVKE